MEIGPYYAPLDHDGLKRLLETAPQDPHAFVQNHVWTISVEQIEHTYLEPDGIVIVGSEMGTVIALSALKRHADRRAEIMQLLVSAQSAPRMYEYAQHMLAALEHYAVELDYRVLTLRIAAPAAMPQRLYLAAGYHQIGREQDGTIEYMLFEKSLPAFFFSDIDPTNAAAVVTAADFQAFLKALVQRVSTASNRSLEAYLRALLGLVRVHRDQPVTFALFASLLEQAFTAPPLPFDETWFAHQSPILPSLSEQDVQHWDDFLLLEDLLLYQIADLHRMQQIGILDADAQSLYSGVRSPTGHTWYNFYPVDSLLVHAPVSPTWQVDSWRDLAIMLWMGQIYE